MWATFNLFSSKKNNLCSIRHKCDQFNRNLMNIQLCIWCILSGIVGYINVVTLKSSLWLSVESACFVITCFHLLSDVLSFTLQTRLGLPHPLSVGLSHCIYSQPLNPIGIYLLCCAHGGERNASHDVIRILLCPSWEMFGFMFYKNKPTFSHHFFFSLLVGGSTLSW